MLQAVIQRVNADVELHALWQVQNINAVDRLGMSDHGPVHMQIVSNIALRLVRLLAAREVERHARVRAPRHGHRRLRVVDERRERPGAGPRHRDLLAGSGHRRDLGEDRAGGDGASLARRFECRLRARPGRGRFGLRNGWVPAGV